MSAFGRGKKDDAPGDAEWAQPADAGAIGAEEEPPPAGAEPVADVPPPAEDTGAVASTSAAAATEATSTWTAPEPAPAPAPVVAKPREPGSIAASLPFGSEIAQERPEVLLGAAFAGAFVFAQILRRITSG